MEYFGLIYRAVSPSGKSYIGKTTQTFEKRKQGHYWDSVSSKKTKFLDAIRKYGFNNFKWEILENKIPISYLNNLEKEYIVKFNSKLNGYNMTDGGDGVYSHEILGKKNPFYGKKHSSEIIQKLSLSRKGKKRSIESRLKQSLSVSGKRNHMYGKKREQYIKDAISKANTKKFVIKTPQNEFFELNGIKEVFKFAESVIGLDGKYFYNKKKVRGYELCLK